MVMRRETTRKVRRMTGRVKARKRKARKRAKAMTNQSSQTSPLNNSFSFNYFERSNF